jgi:hypothetical protein
MYADVPSGCSIDFFLKSAVTTCSIDYTVDYTTPVSNYIIRGTDLVMNSALHVSVGG